MSISNLEVPNTRDLYCGSLVLSGTDSTRLAAADTLTGPFTSPAATTVNLVKIGRIVTLQVTEVSGAANASAIITHSYNIPSGFRPVADVRFSVPALSNSASVLGVVTITTAGAITQSSSADPSGAFAATGNAGIRGFSVSYVLA